MDSAGGVAEPGVSERRHPSSHSRRSLRQSGALGSRGLQLTDPEFEIVRTDGAGHDDAGIHTGRIVPVYERTGNVTTNMQRRLVWDALQQLPGEMFDPVPDEIRSRERWPGRREALVGAHFPENNTPIESLNAFQTVHQRRVIFEDFLSTRRGWRCDDSRTPK